MHQTPKLSVSPTTTGIMAGITVASTVMRCHKLTQKLPTAI
jgi:hypothetical protein